MNQNFSGAVLLLILAAAGFQTNTPAAWWFAGLTAAIAFLAEEARAYHEMRGSSRAYAANVGLALASWAAVVVSALSLLV
jgi:hypothetical protein